MSIYDTIIGGPCGLCGSKHPGQTCEQHQAELNRVANRLAKAILDTARTPESSEPQGEPR